MTKNEGFVESLIGDWTRKIINPIFDAVEEEAHKRLRKMFRTRFASFLIMAGVGVGLIAGYFFIREVLLIQRWIAFLILSMVMIVSGIIIRWR